MIPVIDLPTPVVVPATTQKTFDKTWVKSIRILSPEPGKPAPATIKYVSAMDNGDGTWTLNDEEHVIQVPDLFAVAVDRAAVATALGAVVLAVGDLIANPLPVPEPEEPQRPSPRNGE